MTKIKTLLYLSPVWVCILFLSISCSSDKSEHPEDNRFSGIRITVMFSPDGLGDGGYNDLILKGVQQVYMSYPEISLSMSLPRTMEEAGAVFDSWLMRIPDDGCTRDLFILASSDYERMAGHIDTLQSGMGVEREVLLFESANPRGLPVTFFSTSMYGAAWLAGKAVAQIGRYAPLVMASYEGEPVTAGVVTGFREGFLAGSGTEPVTEYLSSDASGFAMAKEAYENMLRWGQKHDFIFPVAGGSNLGVYRYLREYPQGIFSAGMDVDQSGICANIMLNVIKNMDKLVECYLGSWIEDGEFPRQTVYGLDSGFVKCAVSPYFKDVLESIIVENRKKAIQNEKEYNDNL